MTNAKYIYGHIVHSCYKVGTNATQDYRAVSGYILAIWMLIPAVIITVAMEGSTEINLLSEVTYCSLL